MAATRFLGCFELLRIGIQMHSYFRITKKRAANLTIAELVAYLQEFISAAFPENLIYCWEASFAEQSTTVLSSIDVFDHTACYVISKPGECDVIDVRLVFEDGNSRTVFQAKSRGRSSENWAIARSVTDATNMLFRFCECPLIEVSLRKSSEVNSIWHDKDKVANLIRDYHLGGQSLMTNPDIQNPAIQIDNNLIAVASRWGW